MSDEGDNNFVRYIYRGEADEEIPRGGKIIVIVADAVTIVRTRTFENHPNIIEVICHEGVEKIEEGAFSNCHSLRRVIMPGVTLVGEFAFFGCDALTEVDSGKLEIIKEHAFSLCKSLRSINLPSVQQLVEERAFAGCDTLTDVKFGNNLRRIERGGFIHCAYLERIAIPLKDGMITMDDTFVECNNLKHVDLVGDIHETIAALQFKEWRDDMNDGVNLINRFLPDADAGDHEWQYGEKTAAIRAWIRYVFRKIMHYKAEHEHFLNGLVAATLHLALPEEIVMRNVLPFLELPSHTFEVEEEDDSDDDEDIMEE